LFKRFFGPHMSPIFDTRGSVGAVGVAVALAAAVALLLAPLAPTATVGLAVAPTTVPRVGAATHAPVRSAALPLRAGQGSAPQPADTYPRHPTAGAESRFWTPLAAVAGAFVGTVVAVLSRHQKAVAAVGAAALLAAPAALAVDVKMGSDTGGLVFVPDTVTIAPGQSVTWVNNAGFPHNVIFDEDDVPAGVDSAALSHEDYLNARGDAVTSTFTAPGTYVFHCEPHEGAGMVGKVIVK